MIYMTNENSFWLFFRLEKAFYFCFINLLNLFIPNQSAGAINSLTAFLVRGNPLTIVLDMTQNHLMLLRVLGYVQFPFMNITPMSTLIKNGNFFFGFTARQPL